MDFLGIGPSELLLILLIIILVIGPRDIGKTARSIGRFLNRLYKSEEWRTITQASRTLRNLPNRLAREAELEDLKEVKSALEDTKKDLEQTKKELNEETRSIGQTQKDWAEEAKKLEKDMKSLTKPPGTEKVSPAPATAASMPSNPAEENLSEQETPHE
jgi:sec-independent protein translocase protein TatB